MEEEFKVGDLVIIKQSKHCMAGGIRLEHRKAFEILCTTPYPVKDIQTLLHVPVPEGGATIVLGAE